MVSVAQDHVLWTIKEWERVFSNESKFNSFKNDSPVYGRLPIGARLHKKFIISIMKYIVGSIIVWGFDKKYVTFCKIREYIFWLKIKFDIWKLKIIWILAIINFTVNFNY